MLGDEIWDEHQWEKYLRENDERIDRYMQVLDDFFEENPRPEDDPERMEQWKDDLRAFVESKGWTEDDLPLFLLLDEEPDDLEDEEDWDIEIDEAFWDFDEDDEDLLDELDDFRNLPIYQHSFDLATDVLDWTDTLPGDVKDSNLVQLCSNLMQVPAKVAKGHGLGYEKDFIGGNIACVKRSLGFANTALELWRELKDEPYLDAERYRHFYERTYEVRNELGLYVQELREQFDLGID